jgi:hypothetical protein
MLANHLKVFLGNEKLVGFGQLLLIAQFAGMHVVVRNNSKLCFAPSYLWTRDSLSFLEFNLTRNVCVLMSVCCLRSFSLVPRIMLSVL